jgi:hypothetical protein
MRKLAGIFFMRRSNCHCSSRSVLLLLSFTEFPEDLLTCHLAAGCNRLVYCESCNKNVNMGTCWAVHWVQAFSKDKVDSNVTQAIESKTSSGYNAAHCDRLKAVCLLYDCYLFRIKVDLGRDGSLNPSCWTCEST